MQLQELERVENELFNQLVQRELERAGITVFTDVQKSTEKPVDDTLEVAEDKDSRVIPLTSIESFSENIFSTENQSIHYRFG